ncbi:MAG TPA: Hsp20/alpha crystallin family protein [Candidatus Acidoferrales bacterium]|nr:Hsp20/alpha crystallin family protein [Candidatus Acidoferrales bacterium]
MADLATRGSAAPGLGGFGALLGFDPFRDFAPTWQQAGGIDVQRTDRGYTVEIPVPGFKPDQINVTVDDRTLTVRGESERRKFTRALLLPEEIDTDNIEAKVENGLLTLTLNVHPKSQPKKIEVKYNN